MWNGCSLMAANDRYSFLSWVSSGLTGSFWRAANADDYNILVYWTSLYMDMFFWVVHRDRIAGLNAKFMIDCLRNYQLVFQIGCSFYIPMLEGFSHHQYQLFPVFLIRAILVDVEWYLTVIYFRFSEPPQAVKLLICAASPVRKTENLRRKWQPTPVFLPGESYGQRNLAGYSPWGRNNQTQLSA